MSIANITALLMALNVFKVKRNDLIRAQKRSKKRSIIKLKNTEH